MDWRYNTIWFDQIDKEKQLHLDLKKDKFDPASLTDIEYSIIWHLHDKQGFECFTKADRLLYLELNWANFKNFQGIEQLKALKRLELHYCLKFEDYSGISSLKESLEFLHIDRAKKLKISNELLELVNLKVLRLNACGDLDNLEFLQHFPFLVDFRFVDTNVLSGDLTPLIQHPNIRSVAFINKKHYNLKDIEVDEKLQQKSTQTFKDYAYREKYATFKYSCLTA